MKKLSLLSMLAMNLAYPRSYIVEAEQTGAPRDEALPVDPTTALTPAQAATEHVAVLTSVPAKHQSTIERVAALLRDAEQDIVDNVEAGIAYLEQLWKDRNAAN